MQRLLPRPQQEQVNILEGQLVSCSGQHWQIGYITTLLLSEAYGPSNREIIGKLAYRLIIGDNGLFPRASSF